jgi:integrase
MSIRGLRAALREVVAAVGIPTRIVPHQFRHTYGKEMLRAGVSFAAVMKLLRHKSPHMTLEYIEITQRKCPQTRELPTNAASWRSEARLAAARHLTRSSTAFPHSRE